MRLLEPEIPKVSDRYASVPAGPPVSVTLSSKKAAVAVVPKANVLDPPKKRLAEA